MNAAAASQLTQETIKELALEREDALHASAEGRAFKSLVMDKIREAATDRTGPKYETFVAVPSSIPVETVIAWLTSLGYTATHPNNFLCIRWPEPRPVGYVPRAGTVRALIEEDDI